MDDSNGRQKGGVWTSLPGILTGVAALITAAATLIAVFYNPLSGPDGNRGSEPEDLSTPNDNPSSLDETLSVAGIWNWQDVGTITIQQNGNEVTGLVNYTNGHQAAFSGHLTGRELTLTWWFTTGNQRGGLDNPQGNGLLSLSDDGLVLSGEFTDLKQNEELYPWMLTRISP